MEQKEKEHKANIEFDRKELLSKPVYSKAELIQDYLSKDCSPTNLLPIGVLKQSQESSPRLVLASYARSGNTYLRSYLESIMGVYTGSDCDIDRPMNLDLYQKGMLGEGLIDSRCWVVKTHYPERFTSSSYLASKCILCVRNPLDTMVSLFNMVATETHDCSVSLADYKRFEKIWADFVMQEVGVWYDFYQFWMAQEIPVHIVRFEDVQERPRETFGELMKFVLGKEQIEGTKIDKYIDLAASTDIPRPYRPRIKLTRDVRDLYPASLQSSLMDEFWDLLIQLGYDSLLTQQPNFTYRDFISEFNASSLKQVLSGASIKKTVRVNDPEQLIRKAGGGKPYRSVELFSSALTGFTKIIDAEGNEREGAAVEYLGKLQTWLKKEDAKP